MRLALSTEPKIGKKALIVEFSADGVQVLSPTLFADDEPSVVATSRQVRPAWMARRRATTGSESMNRAAC